MTAATGEYGRTTGMGTGELLYEIYCIYSEISILYMLYRTCVVQLYTYIYTLLVCDFHDQMV